MGPLVHEGDRQDCSHQPQSSNGKLAELQGFKEELCGANGAHKGLTWSGRSHIFSEKDLKDE